MPLSPALQVSIFFKELFIILISSWESKKWQDELLWGAAWLHKATKNPTYLNYIQVNGQTLGAAQFDNTFGWDNKHVGARILLSKVPILTYSS